MKNLCIIENISDPSTWEKVEVESVSAYLFERYGVMPTGGRLYRGNVSELTDITPTCEKEIEDLEALQDDIYFVVYPEDFATAMLVIQIVIAVVSIAIAFLVKPKIPNVSSRLNNSQMASPNNALSGRGNQARPNARIPDIYGQVRCYPDLLTLPFKFYENNVEFEHAFMGIGRGYYQIDEVKDGETKIQEITGTRCAIYNPGSNPNSGSSFYQVGNDINIPISVAKRSNSVDGQTLKPSGFERVTGSMYLQGPNKIISSNTNINMSLYFSPGDTVIFSGGNGHLIEGSMYSFGGTYEVTDVTSNTVYLSNPALVNSSWTLLLPDLISYDSEGEFEETLTKSNSTYVGYFNLDSNSINEIWCNFVAPNGLYKDDGNNKYPFDITVRTEIQRIDQNGDPIGSSSQVDSTITGSTLGQVDRGFTLKITNLVTGKYKIRVIRLTETDLGFQGSVVDELKWRDLYYFSEATGFNTTDITTCQVVTKATPQALALKERKLNILLTRKLNGTATKSAFEALKSVISDPRIGNMTAPSSFGVTESEIQTYFGTTKATEFSYTFDNSNVSFEEMVSTIASAIHCTAYRQGSTIKLKFEKDEENAVLLFNHRNKIPDSETRIVNFGWNGENDGVEYTFVDPSDDSIDTIYFPENRSAIKPKKIESIGVRSRLQAYFIARRIYNKIRYQNLTCEFDALQESNILVMGDKLLVSDSTRAGVQDGQIEAQNGLELTLSQSVTSDPLVGNTIYLQHVDGTTEALACTAGSDSHKILLSQAPKAPLSLDWDHYAKATYLLVSNSDTRIRDFLLVEKNPKGNFTNSLKCINYDARYYQNDTDFINNLIDEDGNPTT